jgi:hypothetical protein
MPNNKYRDYIDIDVGYFPCIDEAAINAGAPWNNTYPHSTFINLLVEMEKAMSRENHGRTLWIEGAYGTGKSQCAYALRKILEVSEAELRAYWDKYEQQLKTGSNLDLLEKLIRHKKNGIVVANRFASGGIVSARHLFFAVQESVKSALVRQNVSYLGENTLKESIIAWLEDMAHKRFFNELLQDHDREWRALFSQSTTDEVLDTLNTSSDVKELVNNIFCLADKEGITALTIDAERLIRWLTDIIDHNKIKIVFVWDEFSDYFKQNRESLSDFQNIASLVQHKPFYFIVVTHETQQIYVADSDRGNQSKVSDRFVSIPITLPDNIAFNLIGEAIKVKVAAKSDWDGLADDLNESLKTSRSKVMEVTKIKNPEIMKKIMPLHPMAALSLKNIASTFQSNQRSMFDFIKSSNANNEKAFQWFIENTGPHDSHPLLTVDMLWDFFYEKHKDKLRPDIRLILDTYSQRPNLREEEESVLKAILIMQAIDQQVGGEIDLFKATEQNLSCVFDGISSGLDISCKNIVKALKNKGILITKPIKGDREAYVAAILAGDQTKIDNHKKEIRQNATTSKLVNEGELFTVLALTPALRLRFESEPGTGKITAVTNDDFTRTINKLREKATGDEWKIHAVIAFAKDEREAADLRKTMRNAVADKQYEKIVFIDALSSPLGLDAFEQYVDFSAMAMYYQSNNNKSSTENTNRAKRILDHDWKNRIYNGQFVVYTYSNQDGNKIGNGQGVASILQTIVTTRFPLIQEFDFVGNLTESQLKLTQAQNSAKYGTGILQDGKGGIVSGLEKYIFHKVWKIDRYWENPLTASLNVSKIKIAIDKHIEDAFDNEGQVEIGEIYDFLEKKYGFAPCNLSAFVAGFLLKEYGGEPFRYGDSSGGYDPMTPEKLAEMLGNCIGKSPKPTYIVKITPDEKSFYSLTEKAWGVDEKSCSSVSQAVIGVTKKMRSFGLPVWCLEEVDETGLFDIIKKYVELVQKEGKEAHRIALDIGNIASKKPSLCDNLSVLLTSENCLKGMRDYLRSFEGGKIVELAKEIGAEDNVLADIRRLFDVEHSHKWDKKVGDDEIRKLLTEYSIIKESNSILNVSTHSMSETYKEWRDKLKFIGISCEALQTKSPVLTKVFDTLLKIYKEEDILYDHSKVFLSELIEHGSRIKELLNNDREVFADIYEPYLEDLRDSDIDELKRTLHMGLFALPKAECNSKIKYAAEEFRKKQLKSQLSRLWYDKTETKSPRDWSNHYRTPILCCVSDTEFNNAKKAFDTLNRNSGTDAEVKAAIEFIESTKLFDNIADKEKRNVAFKKNIISEYGALLPDCDMVRDALDHLSVDIYDWYDNPGVKNKVRQLAEAEYNAGGSDKVLQKIDEMDDEKLKSYLKRLIKDNVRVGMEILAN